MKKIMMTLAAIAVAATMNAQGYIGGTFNLGFENKLIDQKNPTKTDATGMAFEIKPEIGYNLSDKWAVAVKVAFAHSGNNAQVAALVANWGINNATTNAFAINPYARYTFVKSGNFSAFVDGGVAYSTIHINGTSDVLGNINQVKVGFNPGVAYAISPKVGLVAHLGDLSYESTWCKAKNVDVKVSEGKFNIGLWNSISFGAYYNF